MSAYSHLDDARSDLSAQAPDRRRAPCRRARRGDGGVRAKRGYYGTPTADIAKAAGISQAYLFRLYPTKQELFVASTERCFDAVCKEFERAAAPHAGDPEAMREAMGARYGEMVADRDMLLGQLHAYAAGDDPVIRDAVRRSYGKLIELVRVTTGADDDALRAFFAMRPADHRHQPRSTSARSTSPGRAAVACTDKD